jgi:hypothetical protein
MVLFEYCEYILRQPALEVKLNLKETGWKDVDWINLALDSDQ